MVFLEWANFTRFSLNAKEALIFLEVAFYGALDNFANSCRILCSTSANSILTFEQSTANILGLNDGGGDEQLSNVICRKVSIYNQTWPGVQKSHLQGPPVAGRKTWLFR